MKYFQLFKLKSIVAIFLIVLFLYVQSPLSQALGNTFFGTYSTLYNITFAQFFFVNAAYPVFGTPVAFAHYQLSRTYFIQGKLEQSLEEAKKELALYPDNVRTYYILGLTYGYLNREPEAIEAFSKFIDAAPMSWAARNDKAWLQFRIGDIDGALATIQPILDHSQDNPWIQNMYGTLLMNKEKYRQAKTAFENAKRITDAYTPELWAQSYPGNDPRIYAQGLDGFKSSIASNLQLIQQKGY